MTIDLPCPSHYTNDTIGTRICQWTLEKPCLRASARHFIIQSMRIQDIRGCVFEATVAPQRIVALVPSVTETLFEFGAGHR